MTLEEFNRRADAISRAKLRPRIGRVNGRWVVWHYWWFPSELPTALTEFINRANREDA